MTQATEIARKVRAGWLLTALPPSTGSATSSPACVIGKTVAGYIRRSGCRKDLAVFGALDGQLFTQLGVGLDEVDKAAVTRALCPGEAQGAGLSDADRALGFRTCGHVLLIPSWA